MRSNKGLLPVAILFCLINIIVFGFKAVLINNGFDTAFLLAANAYLLVIHVVTYLIQRRTLTNTNPNAFIRAVLGGMMFKMFTTVILLAGYVVFTNGDYNKKALFAAMLLYLVYLAAEVIPISQMLKNRK